MQLSQYFSEYEFCRSETASKYKIDNSFKMKVHRENAIYLCKFVLDPLREKFGKIRITSGYRCPELNSKIGGVPDSLHLVGKATDIFPLEANLNQVWEYIKLKHIGGKAIKPSQFIHIDTGANRTWIY